MAINSTGLVDSRISKTWKPLKETSTEACSTRFGRSNVGIRTVAHKNGKPEGTFAEQSPLFKTSSSRLERFNFHDRPTMPELVVKLIPTTLEPTFDPESTHKLEENHRRKKALTD
jgi:hypothetical protein